MNIPGPWALNTADSSRDETKRKESPGSFFFTQGHAIVLASAYFRDDRLVAARKGVVRKHRHKNHLALFGQLMASFEYLSKEIIAKAVDVTDFLDTQLPKCEWIKLNSSHILATRNVITTPGSVLIGPTQGWHSAEALNQRFRFFFGSDPIPQTATRDLDRLWILRHSVAHNAGYVTNHDSMRINRPALSEKVVSIGDTFIQDTFNFLSPLAEQMTTVAGQSFLGRLKDEIAIQGKSYERDASLYRSIKLLATYVKSRTQSLPDIGETEYDADFL